MKDFLILILGSDANAYYMARCCYEAYHQKAHLIGKERLAFTKYSNILTVEYHENIWQEKEFLKLINDYALKHSSQMILLISTNETYSHFIAKCQEKFRENVVYCKQNLNVLESLANKEMFYKTYQDQNLLFPQTTYYDCQEKIIPLICHFPVVVKPANVVAYNHLSFLGKHKVYKVDNQIELEKILNFLEEQGYQDKVIVQEYIKGDDSHLFDSVIYVDKYHKVKVISFAQIGLQERTCSMVGNAACLINGYSSFKKAPIAQMKKDIIKFMENLDYCGFAEIDMKYDEETNTFKVLEINARQGRCSYYITKLGANLVQILVDDLILDKNSPMLDLTNEVLLSFVPKGIIKKYIDNQEFKQKAMTLWRKKVSPMECHLDKNVKRFFMLKKRKIHYYTDYKNAYWKS